MVDKVQSGSDVLKALPAPPDSGDAGFAIGLTSKKATKLGNPSNSLSDGGRVVRECMGFVNAHVKRLPFDSGQDGSTRGVGLSALYEGHPVQTPSNDAH